LGGEWAGAARKLTGPAATWPFHAKFHDEYWRFFNMLGDDARKFARMRHEELSADRKNPPE
jgi:hypothetical protein